MGLIDISSTIIYVNYDCSEHSPFCFVNQQVQQILIPIFTLSPDDYQTFIVKFLLSIIIKYNTFLSYVFY